MAQLYVRSGGESVANTITAGNQSQPAMALLESGEFVIVWVSETSPGSGNWQIRGQLYEADGDKLGGEFSAGADTGLVGQPRVAALSTGGFVVSWTVDLHDGTGTRPANLLALRIRAQIFDPGAAKVGGELAIGPATGDNFDSHVAGLAGGGFAVTWTQDGGTSTSSNFNPVGQVFDGAGAPVSAQLDLASTTSGFQLDTVVAALPGGGFVAAWTDATAAVRAQIFDSVGAKTGGEFLVSELASAPQVGPEIAVLASGGFVVTWTDFLGDDSSLGVNGQMFDPAGAKIGGQFLVNSTTEDSQSQSSVSALPGGGFVATWMDSSQGDPDIRAQVFDSAGAKAGAEFRVNLVFGGSQLMPAVIGLAAGGFATAWTDQAGSDGDSSGVKVQLFEPSVGGPTDILLSATEVEETAIENVAIARLSTDGAANSGFSYAIVADSSGGAFRIEGDQLVVADNARLDYEAAPEVNLTIRTTDDNGQSFEEAFTLDVLDVGYERRYSAQDEFQANLTEPGQQFNSRIVPLAGGGFALVWLQYDPSDPAPNKTVLRFFDADGAPRSLEYVIAEDWLLDFQATPLANGGLLIVRTAVHEPEGVFSIKAQAYDIDANAVGPEIIVASSGSPSPHSPSAVELSSGEYLISWTTAQGEVHARRVTSEGVPTGDELVLATSPDSVPISLAATIPSGFVAAWVEPRASEEDPFFVRAQIYDYADGLAGQSVSIPVDGLDIGDVTVIRLADGSFMLGWVESLGEVEGIVVQAVVAQHLGADGALIGEPLLLTVFAAEDDFGSVSFAPHPDEGFVVLWPMIDLDAGTGEHVFLGSLFNDCGCPIGSLFQANELGFGGVATVLADGTIATSWSGPDGDESGVFARVFTPAEEPLDMSGDDHLIGDEHVNSLDGQGGDDRIYGLEEDDDLIGGPGNDLLDGGPGADTMTGGPGNDVYSVDEEGDTVVEEGGEGTDQIETGLAEFSLAGLPDVENLVGTSILGQTLTGNAADNVIYSGPGKDFIDLQAGGVDFASAGEGNDVFLFGASMNSDDSVDGGAGTDQIALQGDYSGPNALTFGSGVTGIENLAILPGHDMRFGDPGTGSYDYDLTLLDRHVAAGVQMVIDANRLRPGEDFTFNGADEEDGSFFIYGGGGTDRLTGGDNEDVFLFGAQGQWGVNDVVNGGAGSDRLVLRGDYVVVFGAGQMAGIEQIAMVSALDTRFGALGDTYDYDLTMDDGNVAGIQMTVDAAALRAVEALAFDGSAEDDGSFRLFGGQGSDDIAGSQNADIIAGGGGGDELTGNGGSDVFRYDASSDSAGRSADHILDFAPGSDKIDLSRIDADSHAAGDQAFRWIGSDDFAGDGAASAGELRAYQSGQSWFVEGDTDGDGDADLLIELSLVGPTALGSGDFLL